MSNIQVKLGRIYIQRCGDLGDPLRMMRTQEIDGKTYFVCNDEDLYAENGHRMSHGLGGVYRPGNRAENPCDLVIEIPMELGVAYRNPEGRLVVLHEYINYIENVGTHLFIDTTGIMHRAFENNLTRDEASDEGLDITPKMLGEREDAIIVMDVNPNKLHKPGPGYLEQMMGGGRSRGMGLFGGGSNLEGHIRQVKFVGPLPKKLEKKNDDDKSGEAEKAKNSSVVYPTFTTFHPASPLVRTILERTISKEVVSTESVPLSEEALTLPSDEETQQELKPIHNEDTDVAKKEPSPNQTKKKSKVGFFGGALIAGMALGLLLVKKEPEEDPYQKMFK